MIQHPIEPVFDKESNILILGSFPSVKSREEGFFYGHPQNRFWKVLAEIWKESVPITIEEKKSFLLRNHIAVWDVIKSCDIEAWSPRQGKYFEVCSCSNLTDAQARRLGIRMKTEKGPVFVNTLNNTVLASPRGLIAFLENNYNDDGSITIPEALRIYMGGKEILKP